MQTIRKNGNKKLVLSCMLIALFHFSCSIYLPNSQFTKDEKKELFKSNTAIIAPYLTPKQKEIIRLCNLSRRNQQLLKKYISIRYGVNYRQFKVNYKNEPSLLRPSFLLTLSAASHALVSGIKATEGHHFFNERLLLFGNFNTLIPGLYSGENCYYGKSNALETFNGWMNSSGHRRNILNAKFKRIGMGSFIHFSTYESNQVQVFSGPKLLDLLFRPTQLK